MNARECVTYRVRTASGELALYGGFLTPDLAVLAAKRMDAQHPEDAPHRVFRVTERTTTTEAPINGV